MKERANLLQRLLRHVPIRWRLVLVSLGLLTLLLGSLGVIISLIAEQDLLSNQVDVLCNEAQVAIKGIMKSNQDHPFRLSYTFLPPEKPSADFLYTASTLAFRLVSPSTNAAILASDGSVLVPGSTSPFALQPISVPPSQVRLALQRSDQHPPYLVLKGANGQPQLVVFLPLVDTFRDHTLGILQISTSTTPIDDFLTTLHLTLFMGVVVLLGLATALIYPLVSVALHPLVEIERTSQRIARGDLSMRIDPPPTDDEIGRLAHSFNQMVARLEEAFQRQKRFVSDVSHELRTPLTALSGSLEMLLLGADRGDLEAARRLARGMYAEVQRLQRMVEDLLVLTRLDAGRLEMRRELIRAEDMLATVCEQAEHLARGQTLRWSVAPGTPPLLGDKDRLRQALLNIVDNALKYTPAEGTVELQANPASGGLVMLSVRDTGEGIPPEALPHVFERFFRADPARSRTGRRPGGSGLGLAITRELVEAQGGKIRLDSRLGEGTTVTILFPAAVDGRIATRGEEAATARRLSQPGSRPS
ncbi:sensor histidine kinase [Thermogemmatispora carboxidivorans]|uniref:sensor histidine kinase n=1 Tax=Thermogemmatispora carboxidivorans TaxID=1382306 RepID=UPI0009DCC883|nr:HAMP domain-containing sensor histidine kinase [Thermogemmatispora carboxidivorans]